MAQIDYLSIVLTGFSTGLGVIVAQHVYDLWLRPHVVATHKLTKALKEEFKNTINGK
jgi:hypothetical protein